MNESMLERWTLLSNFVYTTCAGRDESHGHVHMKAVATTAQLIAETDYASDPDYASILMDAITVGWLHDVSDHKYDHDGTLDLRLDEFGYAHIANFKEIKQAIKLISYSSENNAIVAGTPIDYESILGTHYATVRHIVSDADKLEAIGTIGISRCAEYTRHNNLGITDQEVNYAVRVHAEEKMLRLKDEFIRTRAGKLLAVPLHQQMIEMLDKM
jgi:HD superfamily phosphodiesterase